MNKKKYIFPILLSVSAPMALGQYNQSINVEGKYVPEIIKIDRINLFPKPASPSVETKALNYDGKSVPADFRANLLPMPAIGWRDNRDYSRHRGYMDMGMGSWLNSTLSAGYRFIDSDATTFGAWLQHNSTSLWKPSKEKESENAKRYRYDETIGVYANHDFNGAGLLTANASLHLGFFNYYGSLYSVPQTGNQSNAIDKFEFPAQKLNDIAVAVGWQSPYKSDGIRWNANVDYHHFGYDKYYYPGQGEELLCIKAPKENSIKLNGGITFPLSETSLINVDLSGEGVTYSGRDSWIQSVGNSAYVTLSPNYSFSKDNLLVQVGVNLNYSHLVNSIDESESKFYISPDVKFDLNVNPMTFYLHLLGGVTPRTLASNYSLDYYQSPRINNSTPIYTPLDATLGMNFGPFSGFSAGLKVAYKITRNQYIGGWYQSYMNSSAGIVAGLPVEAAAGNKLNYRLGWDEGINLNGFSLGANLGYDAGRYFKINGEGSYQPQNGTKGYFNGYDRPRWIATLQAETNPWKSLKLKLAYEYRGVRQIYTKAELFTPLIVENVSVAMRLPDITNLNFGASYGLSDNFDLWVQVDNILNTRRMLLPALPEPGVCAYIGFGLKF